MTGLKAIDSLIPIGRGSANLLLVTDKQAKLLLLLMHLNQKAVNDAAGKDDSQKLFCI